jgi:hypothetical protein
VGIMDMEEFDKQFGFPYEFDLYFDCKTRGDCYRELQRLSDKAKEYVEKYEHLHRLMRENHISVREFPYKVDL